MDFYGNTQQIGLDICDSFKRTRTTEKETTEGEPGVYVS